MNKTSSRRESLKLVCLSARNRASPLINYTPTTNRSINSRIIPNIQQAEKTDKELEKRHKWTKEYRRKKLEQTYNQNCRLFFSINSQKSSYKFPSLKKQKSSKKQGKQNIKTLPVRKNVANNNRYQYKMTENTQNKTNYNGIVLNKSQLNKNRQNDIYYLIKRSYNTPLGYNNKKVYRHVKKQVQQGIQQLGSRYKTDYLA